MPPFRRGTLLLQGRHASAATSGEPMTRITAYVYVATTEDDTAKLVRPFGTPQTLAELRDEEIVLRELDHVDITLGASHGKIVEKVDAVSGVERVDMIELKEGDTEGDPTDGSFYITRAPGGDWSEIMPAIHKIIAELLGVTPEEVVMSDYLRHDAA